MITIGAGVGLMGFSVFFADLILLNFTHNKKLFQKLKEVHANDMDEIETINIENMKIYDDCKVLLLVVKPQDMAGVLEEIKGALNPDALIVTFAAGKKIDFIASILGGKRSIIRVMPNTPALVGEGMAAISSGPEVLPAHTHFVRGFLEATGQVVEVEEALQDAVTAVSGSGPAYFFAFIEAMVSAGIDLGLSQEVATQLSVQTMVGAAKLLATSDKSATTLRENVTSPNGTTAAALASFSQDELGKIVNTAMRAARDRSQELA